MGLIADGARTDELWDNIVIESLGQSLQRHHVPFWKVIEDFVEYVLRFAQLLSCVVDLVIHFVNKLENVEVADFEIIIEQFIKISQI